MKPGEELSPNSDIWRQYAQEAKEYDDDLALGRDKNLDTMLLFVRVLCTHKRTTTNEPLPGWFVLGHPHRIFDRIHGHVRARLGRNIDSSST